MYDSRSFLNEILASAAKVDDDPFGVWIISGRASIFRLGVKGSGSRMFLGKALKTRFRIWIAFDGIQSHNS